MSPRAERPAWLRLGLVPVVGAAFAALWWRLPRVFRVSELALGELIEPLLLTPKDVELMLALLGVGGARVEWFGVSCRITAEQASQETHDIQMLRRSAFEMFRRCPATSIVSLSVSQQNRNASATVMNVWSVAVPGGIRMDVLEALGNMGSP